MYTRSVSETNERQVKKVGFELDTDYFTFTKRNFVCAPMFRMDSFKQFFIFKLTILILPIIKLRALRAI